MSDLWPDDLEDSTVDAHSPLTILREQASLLGAKTKNIVKAKVVRSTDLLSENERQRRESIAAVVDFPVSKTPFNYAFLIHSPALGDYRYRLFDVSFGIGYYPLGLRIDEGILQELQIDPKEEIIVDDEPKFEDLLSRILKSRRTRQVIHSILYHSLESPDSVTRRSG